jgi:hypothetical protein
LKAADLRVEKKFRVKTVTEEMVGMDKDKEQKLVVWFTNDRRGLVLNRINNRALRSAYGDAVEGWAGKIIALFPTMAEFRGKMTPALRVRIPPPKQPNEAPVAPLPPPQPSPSGNAAAVAVQPAASQPATAAPTVDDPELEPDPMTSLAEELDDEIPF